MRDPTKRKVRFVKSLFDTAIRSVDQANEIETPKRAELGPE